MVTEDPGSIGVTLNAKILRMCVTAIVAFAVGKLFYAPLFFVLWPGLYLVWHYWSRRASREPGAQRLVAERPWPGAHGAPRVAAANAPPGAPGVSAGNKRSVLGRNLGITGIVFAGCIAASFLHLYLSQQSVHRKAEKARSSVQAGMSVAEVLHSVTGWFALGVFSDAPETDPEHLRAVSFGFHSESNKFSYYRRASGASRELSESEALGVLHQELGDGTIWRFKYTFITSTPLHLSFKVVFDKNGRVQEVTPLYAWD